MERVFNKLVRDNIPEKIKSNGEEAVIRFLDDNEYKEELLKKLLEESNEVIEAKGDKILEELADVLEIIKALAELNGKMVDDIIEIANHKRLKRGGFEKRIFLERTYSKEDKKDN